MEPILTDGEQEEEEVVVYVDVGEDVGDDETLVEDDMSCIDDGVSDTAGSGLKRKRTVRFVIRSRAFL